jgi:hypothetical protein
MKIRFSFILLTLFFVIAPVNAAKEPITLELSVASVFAPYADTLFESPAYAALAFQNSGTAISLSRPMRILSPKELQIGTERLIFESKKGNVYRYKASIGLPFGKEIAIPVEIDASNLVGGQLRIRAYPIGSGLIPKDLISKVESKIQSLANANAQKNLIDYLVRRTKGRLDSAETKSQLFSQITFDAINQMNLSSASSINRGDVGQAESLSGQLPLIIAIAIWIIGLPIGLYLIRRLRLRTPNSQSV